HPRPAPAGAAAPQPRRRSGAAPAPAAGGGATLTVLLSGREATLPDTALSYAEGRFLQAVSPVR
ncbi:glutamate racemase, partial [Streptomyces tricolor]